METPKAFVGVRGDQVILASAEATNKKLPKDTVLVSWTSDSALKTEGENTKEWNVGWKTEVIWKSDNKRYRLEKLIKEVCPNVGEICKYAPFPAGAWPTVLVKKDPTKNHSFLSKATEKEHIHKVVRLAQETTSISVLWVLEKKSARLDPVGLALVTNKQLVLHGSGELIM